MQLDPRMQIANVAFTADRVLLELEDGRVIGGPLAWFPRLETATATQRRHRLLQPEGNVVAWPELDEAIAARWLAGHEHATLVESTTNLPAPI
jgi:hypothetical protein